MDTIQDTHSPGSGRIRLSEEEQVKKELTDNDSRRVVNVELAADADMDKEFEVCRTGKFADWRYGTLELTESLFETLKKNFDEKVLGTDVALDADHNPGHGALAWIKSLEIRDGILLAKFRDWTEEGKTALKQRKFKYFSIEYGPHTKVQDDETKLVTPNVLMGIGMTNRPVVKGLKPTFLSESIKHSLGEPKPGDNQNDHMKVKEMIMKFGQSLLKTEGGVSEADRKRFSEMYSELSEEERDEELKNLSSQVEAEAKKTAEAEAKALAEKKKAEEAAKLSESEKDKELSELSRKVEAAEQREAERELAEAVKAITLSNEVKTGFVAAAKEKVEAFVKGLSIEQRKEFTALLGEIRTTDKSNLVELGESGSAKPGEKSLETSEAKLAEANEKAEKLAKEKDMPLHEALSQVYKEMGLTDEPAA